MINGTPKMKYGTITVVAADNLASNLLGGFKEGSTAHRRCRHCDATPSEIASVFNESDLQLRRPTNHIQRCQQIEAAPTKSERDRLSTEYGINRRTVLDDLQYFKVVSGALVQDIMHDILEGMCPFIRSVK